LLLLLLEEGREEEGGVGGGGGRWWAHYALEPFVSEHVKAAPKHLVENVGEEGTVCVWVGIGGRRRK
jgi:hypothetical protein